MGAMNEHVANTKSLHLIAPCRFHFVAMYRRVLGGAVANTVSRRAFSTTAVAQVRFYAASHSPALSPRSCMCLHPRLPNDPSAPL